MNKIFKVVAWSQPQEIQTQSGSMKKATVQLQEIGGLSVTQDGAYFFYCKVYKDEGLDYAEVMRKELEEALS